VQFDTRRDISSIAWSHLRPDDIAVAYLFRPEIHIFDISQVKSDNRGTEEAPTRILESGIKGGSGHNVILYWHSVKYGTSLHTSGTTAHGTGQRPASHGVVRRETEGIAAGSVSGHIRFWATSLSPTVRSNTQAYTWSVLADPHRTTSTASPVVALLAVANGPASVSTTRKGHIAQTLLLAATAQGVITVWDISFLRPTNIGPIEPEPTCIRRIDYAAQLLFGGSVSLVGVCQTRPSLCKFCKESELCKASRDADENKGQLLLNWDTLWRQQCVEIVTTVPDVRADTPNSMIDAKAGFRTGAGTSPASEVVCASLLLTLSSGAIYSVELHTDCCRMLKAAPRCRQAHSANSNATASHEGEISDDPLEGIVVSYENLSREEALALGQKSGTHATNTQTSFLASIDRNC
jgi:hypothetical protein